MGNHIFPGNRKYYVNRIREMVSFELCKEIEKGARDQTKNIFLQKVLLSRRNVFFVRLTYLLSIRDLYLRQFLILAYSFIIECSCNFYMICKAQSVKLVCKS